MSVAQAPPRRRPRTSPLAPCVEPAPAAASAGLRQRARVVSRLNSSQSRACLRDHDGVWPSPDRSGAGSTMPTSGRRRPQTLDRGGHTPGVGRRGSGSDGSPYTRTAGRPGRDGA